MVDGVPQRRERQTLLQPSSLVFDPKGQLFALDTLTEAISRCEHGRVAETLSPKTHDFDTAGGLSGARAMVFDHDGTLLVADSQNHHVVRLELTTSKVSPVAGEFRKPGFRFFFQAEDGIRDLYVTGVQTCALPISVKTEKMNGRQINDEVINELLSLADWAPTHARTEPWRFIIFGGSGVQRFAQRHAAIDRKSVV